MSSRYKISGPDVTFESFEGEILIINLANGNYHSLRGVAVQVWPLVVAGQCAAEVAKLWPNEAGAEADIATFGEALVAAGLCVMRGDDAIEVVSVPEVVVDYDAPKIENYTDMADLLMLDPIHEVDAVGWPKAAEEKTESHS